MCELSHQSFSSKKTKPLGMQSMGQNVHKAWGSSLAFVQNSVVWVSKMNMYIFHMCNLDVDDIAVFPFEIAVARKSVRIWTGNMSSFLPPRFCVEVYRSRPQYDRQALTTMHKPVPWSWSELPSFQGKAGKNDVDIFCTFCSWAFRPLFKRTESFSVFCRSVFLKLWVETH